jgi:alkylhydroperoxidase family enzyme
MAEDACRPAWIATVDEAEAEGDVAEAYTHCADATRHLVPHIWKVHSLNPRSLLDHYRFYRTLLYGQSPLKREQREMIGVVVSAINGCHY